MKFFEAEFRDNLCDNKENESYLMVPQELELEVFGPGGFMRGGGLVDLEKFPEVFGLRERGVGPHVLDFANPRVNWFVFSERVVRVLNSVASGFMQFLPLTIYSHNRRERQDDFFLGRFVHCIKCIDRERCTVAGWEPDAVGKLSIQPPVWFKADLLKDYPVVCGMEWAENFFREEVKDALCELPELSGVTFKEMLLT